MELYEVMRTTFAAHYLNKMRAFGDRVSSPCDMLVWPHEHQRRFKVPVNQLFVQPQHFERKPRCWRRWNLGFRRSR